MILFVPLHFQEYVYRYDYEAIVCLWWGGGIERMSTDNIRVVTTPLIIFHTWRLQLLKPKVHPCVKKN